MNLLELRKRLQSEGVDPRNYHLGAGYSENEFVVLEEQDAWHVFFAERGERFDESTFLSEAEACDDMLERILKDPTTREQWKG